MATPVPTFAVKYDPLTNALVAPTAASIKNGNSVESSVTISAQTGDFTAGLLTSQTLYSVNPSVAGTAVCTLPSASSVSDGFTIIVYNDTDGESVTIARAGSDTINGATSWRVPGRDMVAVTRASSSAWLVTMKPPSDVGTLRHASGVTVPVGWLAAYGQSLDRTTYAGLFAEQCQTATVTFSNQGGNLLCTWTAHLFQTGQTVAFTAGTSTPTGITANTLYYVINATANTFLLATSYANAIATTAIAFTNAGTGTQTGRSIPYGAVDSTHFNAPDCRSRALLGAPAMGGTNANRLTNGYSTAGGLVGFGTGGAGGEESHPLLQGESAGLAMDSVTVVTSDLSVVTGYNGDSGGPHNTVQPSIVIGQIIIKT